MPTFGPINRTDLIVALRRAGFNGPYHGRRHQVMERAGKRLRIPNPHRGDISMNLVASILRQAGISREEWERL